MHAISYLKLVRDFPLRPLRSDAELDGAIQVINSLLDRDDLDPGEQDYLDVLSDLVERYEDEHYPIADVPGHEMLAYLMEQKQVTQSEVSSATGIAVSTLSEILKGKRKLNRSHIEN
jgi:HTH-type transcriptional regulator/antitoxin HigA